MKMLLSMSRVSCLSPSNTNHYIKLQFSISSILIIHPNIATTEQLWATSMFYFLYSNHHYPENFYYVVVLLEH